MSSNRSPATGSKRSPWRTDDVVEVVELHRQRRQCDGPRVDVGGDDAAAVAGRVHGLDPATGAEVERGVDRSTDRRSGKGGGRGADAEYVVGGDGAGWPGSIVGDEPIVGITERSDHDAASGVVAVDGDHTAGDPLLERQRCERMTRGGDADRLADEEETGEHVELITRPGGAHEWGQFAGGEVGEGVRAEPLGDRGQRVAGSVERLAGSPYVVCSFEESHPMIVPPSGDPAVSDGARPTG